MDRGKLYKILVENEELDSSSLKVISEHIWGAKPSVIINYISNKPYIDFRLGGEISECFEQEESLSGHDGEVRYIAKVVSDKYVLHNARQLKFYSSKFRLEDGFQGMYTVDHVDLYGSELTTITPPPIDYISLYDYSKATVHLKEPCRYKSGVKLTGVSLSGNGCEFSMKAEIEDRINRGKFGLRVNGENGRAEIDLRKMKLDKLEIFFNHSGPNNYIHVRVGSSTVVELGFWNGDPNGVKVIIEGGVVMNASELINSGVDYEQR